MKKTKQNKKMYKKTMFTIIFCEENK